MTLSKWEGMLADIGQRNAGVAFHERGALKDALLLSVLNRALKGEL